VTKHPVGSHPVGSNLLRLALFIGLSLVTTAGCRSSRDRDAQLASSRQSAPTQVPANGYVEQWQAPLQLARGSHLARLYLRGDTLFVYTNVNRVYALSADGGHILWGAKVAGDEDTLLPPLVLKDVTIFPTSATLELYQAGKKLRSIELGSAVRSPLAGEGNVVYCGLDYKNGGRLAKLDITKTFGNTLWELMTQGGISAAPVLFEKIIYAASEDGAVHAVNEERIAAWGLEGSLFRTGGTITADLKVDEQGLYVPSTDSKLYCLNRGTGRILWQFYGGAPLLATPSLTADSIYQPVPGRGVAALDKGQGEFNRRPRWIAPDTIQFLSEDGTNVYLRGRDNRIIGVDKKTGETRGHSNRKDLTLYVSNTKTPLIFGAARNGTVVCARPVLKPGVVGEIVLNDAREDTR
jgi:hypothetical protein